MSTDNRFHITGIDRLTFGVMDLDEARRFADDWGLAAVPGGHPQAAHRL